MPEGDSRVPGVAILFPGQGSQYPGMVDPWLDHPAGREVIEEASAVLGYDLADTARSEDRLADTSVVQPALFAAGLAAFRVLEAQGVPGDFAAGHSVGEFAALAASGALEQDDALRVVVERGRAMQESSDRSPGAMTAIIGVGPDDAADICRIAGRGDVLSVANENSPRQTVLSGTVPAIERAEALARSAGARVVRLRVAGAFHSPLMRPAADRVRTALAGLRFHRPRVPVVPNASGRPATHPAVIRDFLARHLTSPVRWERSMRALGASGVRVFVEAGPGDVLSKLVRRCVPDAEAVPAGSPHAVRELAGRLGGRG